MKLLKNYNFWIRLVAVVVLLLRVIGTEFGFSVDSGLIIDIATAVASVLVVLGVIQVPVDTTSTNASQDGKNNGGEFMNSYEQIKQDLTIAKDKLIANFETNDTLVEITKIIDNILGTNIEETIDEIKQEDVASKPELETIVIESGEEVKSEIPVMEDEQAVNEQEVMEEPVVETALDIPNSEETEKKIKEILRAKLMEILDRDLDDIITQIS